MVEPYQFSANFLFGRSDKDEMNPKRISYLNITICSGLNDLEWNICSTGCFTMKLFNSPINLTKVKADRKFYKI